MKANAINKNDFEKLVIEIEQQNNLSREELSEMLGHRKTYLTELISRGNITNKHVIALRNLFKDNDKRKRNEIEVLKKSVDILLIEVARLSAKPPTTPTKRLAELKEEIALQLGVSSDVLVF